MWNSNVETFIGCEASFEEAEIVLFGAPFDSTTSYRPGARFGSRAIRSESFGLETYSPYQDRDLSEIRVFDGGDIELPFGNTEQALAMIGEKTELVLEHGKLPCMLGGEHLVTLGAFREVFKRFGDVCVIHFDAHTDLRDEYLGVKLSHASVIRRIWEMTGDKRIFQFGIRSGERDEFYWAREHTCLNQFDFTGLEKAVAAIGDRPVYLTIDLDVLDPSVLPGTGTPEAGGVTFTALLEAIKKVSSLQIVGMDVNELAPNLDQSGASTAAACKAVRELLLAVGIERQKRIH